MEMLSMNELNARTGVSKTKLVRLVEQGVLRGEKTPGRTGSWLVPEDQIEIASRYKTPHMGRPRNSTNPYTPEAAGLDDNWVLISEAAKITGLHGDTIRGRIERGELETQKRIIGSREITFVNRNNLPVAKVKKPGRPRKDVMDTATPSGPTAAPAAKRMRVKEAADYKGVTVSTIHNAVATGRLKSERVQISPGRYAHYLTKEDLDNYKATPRANYNKSPKQAQASTPRLAIRSVEPASLNGEFQQIAEMVGSGKFEVVALDVQLRFKQGGE